MNSFNQLFMPSSARFSSFTETDSVDALKKEMANTQKEIDENVKNISIQRAALQKWQDLKVNCVWSGGISGIGKACGGAWKCYGHCTAYDSGSINKGIEDTQGAIDTMQALIKVKSELIGKIQERISYLNAISTKETFINKPVDEKIAESAAAIMAKAKNILGVTGIAVISVICIGGAYFLFKKAKVTA